MLFKKRSQRFVGLLACSIVERSFLIHFVGCSFRSCSHIRTTIQSVRRSCLAFSLSRLRFLSIFALQ